MRDCHQPALSDIHRNDDHNVTDHDDFVLAHEHRHQLRLERGGQRHLVPGGDKHVGQFDRQWQKVSSRQVYFKSAFGAPVSKEVAAAAIGPSIDTRPVASAITQLPRIMILLFPAGMLLLLLVASLVLETREGGLEATSLPRSSA